MITQTPIRFESVFADELTKYIKYKRSLGMQYDRPEYELVTFSKFLADNNVSEMTISKEIAEKWCCRRVDEGHKMWANRTGIYRQFALIKMVTLHTYHPCRKGISQNISHTSSPKKKF